MLTRCVYYSAAVGVAFSLATVATAETFDSVDLDLEYSATIVPLGPGGKNVVRLHSDQPGDASTFFGSNVVWRPQTHVTWGDLTGLEATFLRELGTFRGGSPRFSVWFDWNDNGILDQEEDDNYHLFSIWGDPSTGWTNDPGDGWQASQNFIGLPDSVPAYETGQISGVSVPSDTYNNTLSLALTQARATAVNNFDLNLPAGETERSILDTAILQIGLVLDGGWGIEQQFLIDTVTIEGIDSDGFAFVEAMAVPAYGDASLDTQVNALDIDILAANWKQAGDWRAGDFNGDGLINGLDLSLLAHNWTDAGQSFDEALALVTGPGGIPEPASALLLAAGVTLLSVTRRRRA